MTRHEAVVEAARMNAQAGYDRWEVDYVFDDDNPGNGYLVALTKEGKQAGIEMNRHEPLPSSTY